MKPILGAILSVSSVRLKDDEKRLLERYNPVGVSLFSRNIENIKQTKALIQNIKEVIGRDDVLIALDEEGGRVDRLKPITDIRLASQALIGASGSVKTAKDHALLVSEMMHDVGANFNFAPVLDLEYATMTTALQSRTFSKGPQKTARLGRALWQMYAKEGICPCIKHLPGHGRAKVDPHLHLPTITASLDELARDFMPFVQNNDCPAGMVAHIVLTAVDDQKPMTFSKKGIENIIRGRIGFDGFLISDALEMGALSGSVADRTRHALAAGLDAVCYCMGDFDGLKAVCEHAKPLSDDALLRFEKVSKVLKTHRPQRKLAFIKERYYSSISLSVEQKIEYDATEVLFKMKQGENKC